MPLGLLLAPLLAAAQGDPGALAILARSRDTQATYAVYSWNRVRTNDQPLHDEWAAEFNRGYQHRVETPKFRVIADCATSQGYIYDVDKGTMRADPMAGAYACGINIARPILSVEARGTEPSAYGPLDILKVKDASDERFYAVDARGVLVRSSIFPVSGSGAYCVQAEPIALVDQLPEGDWFTPESLKRSAVSANYRQPVPIDHPSVSGQTCR